MKDVPKAIEAVWKIESTSAAQLRIAPTRPARARRFRASRFAVASVTAGGNRNRPRGRTRDTLGTRPNRV